VKVSRRQCQIIEMLIESKREMTVTEISRELSVSSRTVHRGLLEIEMILESFGVTLLKKAGTGIQLHARPEQLMELQKQLIHVNKTEYTSEERKVLIICKLLEINEPIKLFSLSHELHAAIPTIINDLDELDSWVRKNELTLVRKRGYGIEIVGTERVKRRAIELLAQDHLDDSMLLDNANESLTDLVSRQLLILVGWEHFFQIEKVLWRLDERDSTNLSEAAYTHLLIRLSIAVTRNLLGMTLSPEEITEKEWIQTEEGLQRYQYLADVMQLHLPPQEEAYITGLFKDWKRVVQPDQGLLTEDLRLLQFVMMLIHLVSTKLSVDLEQDRSLKEGLLLHIESTYDRIKNGEFIRNPLLSQIRKDYEELFEVVNSAILEIVEEFKVPDEEIAFLVMHFGAALERNRQKSLRVKALLVCTSGIGSSKHLAVRIEKELPQIELLAHISWYEASRISKDDYDLVISTVSLPVPSDQYIKISPLLTMDEVMKLQLFIQNITVKQSTTIGGKGRQSGYSSFDLITSIGSYSKIIIQLIERFQIHPLAVNSDAGIADLRSIVQTMCETMHERGYMDCVEPIVELLMQRELMGSQVIANSGLALFHTRSEAVGDPSLALFRFESPVHWGGLGDHQVRQILLMLGPKELDKQTLEILSEFSVLLLEPGFIDRLEKEDEESIKRLFSNNFELFIKTKLDGSDSL